MKKLFAATLLASTIAGIGFASAMTPAPYASSTGADVIQVAGGCGLGFHRGPYGGCQPNRYVRPVYRPIVVAPVRRCPPGQGMTRFGCRWR